MFFCNFFFVHLPTLIRAVCAHRMLAESASDSFALCIQYSISRYAFCVLFCPCVHGKWREAWKSEKRSTKGYEVERKGTREHLKADFGNVQGQQLPKIVPVTAGYCLTCP